MVSNGGIHPLAISKVDVTEVYDSTGVIVIATTEDKLRRLLDSYEQAHKRFQGSRITWLPRLSLFVALTAAEATDPSADWLPSVVVGPFFKLSLFGVGAFAVLFWFLYSAFQPRTERADPMSIDDVVQKLKDDSQPIVSTVTRGDDRRGEVATPSAATIGERQND